MDLRENISSFSNYQPSLRKSQRDPSCIGKGTFNLRFDAIKQIFGKRNFCAFFCSFLKFRCNYQVINIPKDLQLLQQQLPMMVPTFTNTANSIRYTWIGHSTAVISFGQDINVLIDPVFNERCSPIQALGPKRYRPPACPLSALPPIHMVLVSHDHYDHLQKGTLQLLHEMHSPYFVAGLDSQDVFPDTRKLVLLDWTDKHSFVFNQQEISVTFVPACHWSRRGATDLNTRLWGGFVIQTANQKVFYSGDTAYCQVFREIGEKYGPFDLCILPVGAYLPRYLLQSQHIDPEQAVIIHKELKSRKSVGVHWGTFPLGFEHYLAPRVDLQIAAKEHQLKEDQFVTIHHGQSLTIAYSHQ